MVINVKKMRIVENMIEEIPLSEDLYSSFFIKKFQVSLCKSTKKL